MQPERGKACSRPREALRAADPGADAGGEGGRARHAAADRGEFRAGQVPFPAAGQLAAFGEGSAGWPEVRDKAHPEAPQGWTLTTKLRGKEREMREFPPAKAVLANLEAFAEAALGGKPYPVPQSEMIANVSALEAIFRSAASGKVE